MSNERTEEDPEQKRIKETNEKRGKIILTILIGFSYMLMGSFRASVTFYVIEITVNIQRVTKPVQPFKLNFTTRWLGYFVGCISGGMAYDYYDLSSQKQALTSVALVAMSLSSFLVPFTNSLTELTIPLFLSGTAMTFCASGLNAFLMCLWGMKTNTAMHIVYSCRSLGNFFIASLHYFHSKNGTQFVQHSTDDEVQEASYRKLIIVFVTMSGLLALSAFTWICTYRYLPIEYQLLGPMSERRNSETVFRHKWLALTSASILFFLSTCKDLAYPKMLTTYEKYFRKEIGIITQTLLLYWGAYLGGRVLAAILTYKYVNQVQMIILCLSMELSAGIVLIMIAYVRSAFLSLATLILGLGAAPLTPATFVWFNKYIVVDSKITAFFHVVGTLAEVIDELCLTTMLMEYPDTGSHVLLITPLGFGMTFAILTAWFHYQARASKRCAERCSRRTRVSFPVKYPERQPKMMQKEDDDQDDQKGLKEMLIARTSLHKYNSETIKLLRELDYSITGEINPPTSRYQSETI